MQRRLPGFLYLTSVFGPPAEHPLASPSAGLGASPPQLLYPVPLGSQPLGSQQLGSQPLGSQQLGAQPLGSQQLGSPPSSQACTSPARVQVGLLDAVAALMADVLEHLANAPESGDAVPVLTGGYAHMSYFQRGSSFYRTIGTHEYGLRDIDVLMVPRSEDAARYEGECARAVDAVERLMHDSLARLRVGRATCRYFEPSQASADRAVVCRAHLSAHSVQRSLSSNAQGLTHVFKLDRHQILNVTMLHRHTFEERVPYKRGWLVFPAWKVVKSGYERKLSRRLFSLLIAGPRYNQEKLRLQIQCAEAAQGRDGDAAVRKRIQLLRRRALWRDEAFIGKARSERRLAAECERAAEARVRRELDWDAARRARQARAEQVASVPTVASVAFVASVASVASVPTVASLPTVASVPAVASSPAVATVERQDELESYRRARLDADAYLGRSMLVDAECQTEAVEHAQAARTAFSAAAPRSRARRQMRTVQCGTEPETLVPVIAADWRDAGWGWVSQDVWFCILLALVVAISGGLRIVVGPPK